MNVFLSVIWTKSNGDYRFLVSILYPNVSFLKKDTFVSRLFIIFVCDFY